MKIQFLETSQPGLRWMVQYYRNNPQLDQKKAFSKFEVTLRTIREFPPSSETFEDFDDVWEIKVQRTAFSVLYTVRGNTAYVIDVRDQRGLRSAAALRKFARECLSSYKVGHQNGLSIGGSGSFA